ncbi:MAG: hypothetical protein M0Q38_15910 [Bacteroidales bacterium]|jgi:hypothetical protein|nr:hypothetical protein [Bacteroidales bacterium]
MEKKLLNLSSGLFWDVEVASLDSSRDAGFIITRVLMHGTGNDWNVIKSHYGLERIRNVALAARYLDKKTLAFCSVIFSIPINKFRCYIFRQLIQGAWNY